VTARVTTLAVPATDDISFCIAAQRDVTTMTISFCVRRVLEQHLTPADIADVR